MRFFQLIFVAVVLVAAVDAIMEDFRDEPVCTCALFGQKGEDKITGVPLSTKALNFEVDCDENRATDCVRLCNALPSVYSKFCYEEVWTYTGLSSSRDYCCVEGKREACQVATE